MERDNFIKTVIPLVLGILAGILSFLITDGTRSRDPLGIIVLVFFIYINKFIFPKLNIRLESKDWLGISLMSFAGWYITWTFLLNA